MSLTLFIIDSTAFHHPFLIFPLPSLPSSRKKLILMTIAMITTLGYAIANVDIEICHKYANSLIEPSSWLIIEGALELAIVAWIIVYTQVDNAFVGGWVWFLSLAYVALMIIGVDMFWLSCLDGFDVVGSFMVGLALLAGMICAFKNIVLIYRIENPPSSESEIDSYTSHV